MAPQCCRIAAHSWCTAAARNGDLMSMQSLAMAGGRLFSLPALPGFLKTYVDRLNFSFTSYLRQEKDSSTELHQWIRRNYSAFRDLELRMLLQGS